VPDAAQEGKISCQGRDAIWRVNIDFGRNDPSLCGIGN
jgi:hypothetical protein